MKVNVDLRNLHTLCVDSYLGIGGYLDGSYLQEFAREENFDARLQNSYYENQIIGMVTSATAPIFGDKVQRTYDTEIYKSFCQNVDMIGTDLTTFLKECSTYHTLLGNVFIVMDNVESPSTTVGSAIKNRDYPFLYKKLPHEMKSVKVDRFGGVEKATFSLGKREINGKETECFRTVSNGAQCDWYTGDDKKRVDIGETIQGTRIIMTGTEIMPVPPFLSLCQIARTIYNMDSEQRDLERAQAFSLLQLPSDMPEKATKIGVHNVLYVGNEGTRDAKYVSPDAQILQTLGISSDRMTVRMKDQARNLGIRVVEKHYKSGTALSHDYAPSYAVLASGSIVFEGVEYDIRNMFNEVAGQSDKTKINYNRDYSPSPDKNVEDYNTLVGAMKTDYGEKRNAIIINHSYEKLESITGLPKE